MVGQSVVSQPKIEYNSCDPIEFGFLSAREADQGRKVYVFSGPVNNPKE